MRTSVCTGSGNGYCRFTVIPTSLCLTLYRWLGFVVFASNALMKGVPRAVKRDECGPCMSREVLLYSVHP